MISILHLINLNDLVISVIFKKKKKKNKQTNKQTNNQTNKQTIKQTNKQNKSKYLKLRNQTF